MSHLIRVVIVADTVGRARDLARLLAEDQHLEIVEARAASGAFNFEEELSPDVLLVARLPAAEIPAGDFPVVVLSDGPPDEGAFTRHVRAWLPLDAPPAEVVAAIGAAANELLTLTPDQARRWLRAPFLPGATGERDEEHDFIEPLTPRELQVLRMLADGLGNKQIAGQLGISEHTAKFHVAQILAKLDAASRTEAVRIGIRRGLVPI